MPSRTPDTGSSPLTRGKRIPPVCLRRTRGLIPTHAGKTLPYGPLRADTWAHPHSRGENVKVSVCFVSSSGSSPLTRGKLGLDRGLRNQRGLIPTHAGKTSAHERVSGRWWAHPHSRGENRQELHDIGRSRGSSPLTRGKRSRTAPRRRAGRLIPTHAGKTKQMSSNRAWMRAHPHSRGENGGSSLAPSYGAGSSPLTRGKPVDQGATGKLDGLIPTHAGKTRKVLCVPYTPWAHPHSRGENRGLLQ